MMIQMNSLFTRVKRIFLSSFCLLLCKIKHLHTASMLERKENSTPTFGVEYCAKDLILYALAIGMGSSDKDVEKELRFLYEKHPKFRPVPTFCLALTFWASKGSGNTCRIPTFPPPLMAEESVIPKRFLRNEDDLASYPVIHTWQSIVWHQSLPTPSSGECSLGRCDGIINTSIRSQTVKIIPKSIGTFITSKSTVFAVDSTANKLSTICIMKSTALVLGIPSESVIPFESDDVAKTKPKSQIIIGKKALLEWTYQTLPSQALLYRLASGDSNKIHVDDSASKMLASGNDKPLLHGLFTLAVAFRALSKVVPLAEERIKRLEGKFSQPAFVGDELRVRIWGTEDESEFLFLITNAKSGQTLVNDGVAEFMNLRSNL